jgi:hypothetical protein
MMIHLIMLKAACAGCIKKVCEEDYNACRINDIG